MMRPELLAPAGDPECLQSALDFGADAVYLGRKQFGMRAASKNFDLQQLEQAVKAAHAQGVAVYLTCNTMPRNGEISLFEQFVKEADACGVDALILADLGLLSLAKQYVPRMELHMSTQTGIVNYASARALYELGAKRVVLARELSLDEIGEIRAKTPKELEIEVFVHGAMCMSFSGRCMLSAFMTGRDANRGVCAQSCRWKYALMEEKRPGQYFPIEETEQGTYFLNAKDLCMLPYLKQLMDAGIDSLKIEGRGKSFYYVAAVTNAYRMALSHWKQYPDQPLPNWISEELERVSHRPYSTGFFFGSPVDGQHYATSGYIRSWDVVGIVDRCENGMLYGIQRNRFFAGDVLEVLSPGKEPVSFPVSEIFNDAGESVPSANHAEMRFSVPCSLSLPSRSILRKRHEETM